MSTLRDTDPMAWLIACEEIRQPASRYAVSLNHRDLDALTELFVADVGIGSELTGRAALLANMATQLDDGHTYARRDGRWLFVRRRHEQQQQQQQQQ